jgi:hypothetical protein
MVLCRSWRAEINGALHVFDFVRNFTDIRKRVFDHETSGDSVPSFCSSLFDVLPHPSVSEQCDLHSWILCLKMKKVDEHWTLYFSDRSNETMYRLPKQFAERKRRSSLALHPASRTG